MQNFIADMELEQSVSTSSAKEYEGTSGEVESKETESGISYKSLRVNSFSRAVEEILLLGKENTICLIDIDGVLIENSLTQYPVICHLFPHNVAQGVERSTRVLVSSLGQDAVSIATNRDENVKIVWSSNRIVNTVQEALQSIGFPNVKIFTGLSKQVPQASKKKREVLVDHYVNYIEENNIKDKLKLCVIEDTTMVSFNRDSFPKEVARKIQSKVKQVLGRDIDVDIIDLVLES